MSKENDISIAIFNMWSTEAESWVTIAEDREELALEDAKQYLNIETRKVPGVCGGSYKSQFLKTRHSSRKIMATVKTVWRHLGESGSSTKQVSVYPGDEKELGCTGWKNPTAFDTTYTRTIEAAWFEN